MTEPVVEVLAGLYREEGAALLTDANRLANMLRDLCPEGTRRQQTMLVNALCEGIPTALLFPSEPLHLLAHRLAGKLEQGRLAFHRDDAVWVVAAWAWVLGKSIAIPFLVSKGPAGSMLKPEVIPEPLGKERSTRSIPTAEADLQPTADKPFCAVEALGVNPGSLPPANAVKVSVPARVWSGLGYLVPFIAPFVMFRSNYRKDSFVSYHASHAILCTAFTAGLWCFGIGWVLVGRLTPAPLNYLGWISIGRGCWFLGIFVHVWMIIWAFSSFVGMVPTWFIRVHVRFCKWQNGGRSMMAIYLIGIVAFLLVGWAFAHSTGDVRDVWWLYWGVGAYLLGSLALFSLRSMLAIVVR